MTTTVPCSAPDNGIGVKSGTICPIWAVTVPDYPHKNRKERQCPYSMFAIYKRELRSYFSSLFGYVYLAFYLLFAGLFTAVICLFGAASSIELSYGYTSFVFLLSVPLLSLKGFAEERRQKTDLLLRTLPMKSWHLVLGKYLAMITLTGLGQLLGFAAVIVLSFYGPINLTSSLCATFAFFLCGCALVAIGLFLSSLSENILVCALTTFGAMLIIYFLPDLILLLPTTAIGSFLVLSVLVLLLGLIAWRVTRSLNVFCLSLCLLEGINIALLIFGGSLMEGFCARIFTALSVTSQLADFVTYGLFDLQGIAYFLSLTCLFTYFTVLSLEKRRWS